MTPRLPPPARESAAAPPAWWAVAFLAGLAVLAVGASVLHAGKVNHLSRNGTQTRTAFLRWRDQIQEFGRGVDIYKAHNYPNPPVQAMILWPLTELPRMAGALVWFYLKVAMAAAALVWVFRLCGEAGRAVPDGAKAVAVLLSLHPILGDLSHGNVNIFIAFLVVGALELFRRGRDGAAGLVLSLAVACKVTPALFLPYFAWKAVWSAVTAYREGRPVVPAAAAGGGVVFASALAGLGLWLVAVPSAVLGADHNLTLLGSWYTGMVKPFVIDGKVTSEHANQSVPGVVVRLLRNEPSVLDYEEDEKPPKVEYHNLADIGPEAARWLVRGCQAAFVLAVVGLCRASVAGPGGSRQGLRLAAEYSLVVLGMLLFSERTWKHHGVTLILPFAVLAAYPAARAVGPGLRAYLVGTLVVVAALTVGPGLVGGAAQDAALTYGSHAAAFLLLTAAVCVVMRAEQFSLKPAPSKSAAAESGSPPSSHQYVESPVD